MLTWPDDAIVQLSVCLYIFISNLSFLIPVSLPKLSRSLGSYLHLKIVTATLLL